MENLKRDPGILDLAIIGGGPAGTAAALEAKRHGLRATIWERGCFPRDKVCGEFISFEALPFLQAEIPLAVAQGAAIRCAEFIPIRGPARVFQLPCPALGLSRRLLDAALWKSAEAAGVEAHEGDCIRTVRKSPRGHGQAGMWEVQSGSRCVWSAKSLIIACGRWWKIAGLPSPANNIEIPEPGDWIGAKAHFAGMPSRGNVEMYFFRGGYCGLAPVENGACNVCCLVHRERARECGAERMKHFAEWLARISNHPMLERRLREAVQVSPVVTTAPVFLSRRQAAECGALLVGDASGFLDPFTGDGISMALHSGRLAAQAIARSLSEGLGEKRAAETYGQSLGQAVRRSYRVAALGRGIVHIPPWLQGLVTAPLPWIGKSLVRKTRWRGKITLPS